MFTKEGLYISPFVEVMTNVPSFAPNTVGWVNGPGEISRVIALSLRYVAVTSANSTIGEKKRTNIMQNRYIFFIVLVPQI
jgi:hypothetical protein